MLCWIHKENRASITRCSQPLVGKLGKRCREDENLFQVIKRVTPGSNKLYIIDARPKLNAVANMVHLCRSTIPAPDRPSLSSAHRDSMHPSIHPLISLSVHPFVSLFIHPSTHLYIHVSIHPPIHLFMHPCIRSFNKPFSFPILSVFCVCSRLVVVAMRMIHIKAVNLSSWTLQTSTLSEKGLFHRQPTQLTSCQYPSLLTARRNCKTSVFLPWTIPTGCRTWNQRDGWNTSRYNAPVDPCVWQGMCDCSDLSLCCM